MFHICFNSDKESHSVTIQTESQLLDRVSSHDKRDINSDILLRSREMGRVGLESSMTPRWRLGYCNRSLEEKAPSCLTFGDCSLRSLNP